MTEEIWKPVVGYEERYKVSNMGNVYSIFSDKILKPGLKPYGYCRVMLCYKGKYKWKRVHTLVFEAFIGPVTKTIDHINGIKTDNRLENLRHCTPRENTCFHYKNKYPGTNYRKTRGQWSATVYANGKQKNLGNFKTQEEAYAAYAKAVEMNGEPVPQPNFEQTTKS